MSVDRSSQQDDTVRGINPTAPTARHQGGSRRTSRGRQDPRGQSGDLSLSLSLSQILSPRSRLLAPSPVSLQTSPSSTQPPPRNVTPHARARATLRCLFPTAYHLLAVRGVVDLSFPSPPFPPARRAPDGLARHETSKQAAGCSTRPKANKILSLSLSLSLQRHTNTVRRRSNSCDTIVLRVSEVEEQFHYVFS